ncbi:MAG: GGDEF domain-containing protein [Candidatus Paceibacterota bacterium]|jgi:diguanylate cyclase (GGDEF)-like protein
MIKKLEKDLSVKQLEAEIARLKNLVYRDELTGMLNRRGFNEEAGKVFKYMYSKHGLSLNRQGDTLPFSIVFIDIDDFKKVNDKYGHDEGDKVLKHTAKIMGRVLRENDIYARWGGEEFVVALPQANKKTAVKVAEKLCNAFADSKIKLGGKPVQVTMSVGIVMHSNEINLHQMIEKADQAMYKAKKRGKNQVVTFTHGEEEGNYFLKLLHLVKGRG